jgi:hypothetical protein
LVLQALSEVLELLPDVLVEECRGDPDTRERGAQANPERARQADSRDAGDPGAGDEFRGAGRQQLKVTGRPGCGDPDPTDRSAS